jgi:hypothetical protein
LRRTKNGGGRGRIKKKQREALASQRTCISCTRKKNRGEGTTAEKRKGRKTGEDRGGKGKEKERKRTKERVESTKKKNRDQKEKTDANQPNREKNRGSTQRDEEKMKTGN